MARQSRWNEELAEKAIRRIMDNKKIRYFPKTCYMFEVTKDHSLRSWLTKNGGFEKFAKKWNIPMASVWDIEKIEYELRKLMKELGKNIMPLQSEIEKVQGLKPAIQAHGGMTKVSEQLGIYTDRVRTERILTMQVKTNQKNKIDILTEQDRERIKKEREAEEKYAAQCKASPVNHNYKGERVFLSQEEIERKFRHIKPEKSLSLYQIGGSPSWNGWGVC